MRLVITGPKTWEEVWAFSTIVYRIYFEAFPLLMEDFF